MNKELENERLRESFEKEMLGNSTRELFFQLNNELENRFLEIKEKFLNTQINEQEDLFIETLLVREEDIFKFYGGFFPIELKNDIEEDIYLEEIYLDMPYQILNDIENEVFEAWINIEDESFELKIVFEKDKRYLEKIEKLYNIFELNGQNWNTINMAHFNRMYRIKVLEYDFEFTKEILDSIKNGKCDIFYDFNYYEENVFRNVKLLWNIEEKKIISSMFVRPTKFDISFEYVLKFDENEKILVDNNGNNDILCTHIENMNELVIISRKNNETVWNIFSVKSIEICEKILEINLKDEKNFEYIHFTNFYKRNFIDKLKQKYKNDKKIKSISDIEKIFLDYEFVKNRFLLKDITFNGNIEENIEIYNSNNFIKNDFDIFNKEKQKLNIFVECLKRDKYTEDILSFIISEINLRLQEYSCWGYLYE